MIYLGIDIGGTSVKFGVVLENGNLVYFNQVDTRELVSEFGFLHGLRREIELVIRNYPALKGIGIGVPGYLSADRKTVLDVVAIPSMNDLNLVEELQEMYPRLEIRMENDANVAALGEYHFGELGDIENFMLVTLGTGVGSATILNGKLFTGGNGNAMELGHVPSRNNKTLEQNIGQQQITSYVMKNLNGRRKTILKAPGIDPAGVYNAAVQGDGFAASVFNYAGELLGEALATSIRILDIDTVMVGGGMGGAFQFLQPGIVRSLRRYLSKYYWKNMNVITASLGAKAGLLGAASLVMHGNGNTNTPINSLNHDAVEESK